MARRKRYFYIAECGELFLAESIEDATTKAYQLAVKNNVKEMRFWRFSTGIRKYAIRTVTNTKGIYTY